MLSVIASKSRTQIRVRDSSAARIFFKKYHDVTSGPENNHRVLASSFISFSLKNFEILAQ